MARGIVVDEGATIMEGHLQKCSRHLQVWRDRYCVLTDRFLCTFKSEECSGKPTEAIRLKDVVALVRTPDGFRLDTRKWRSFDFVSDSSTDLELWINAIRLFTPKQASVAPASAAPPRVATSPAAGWSTAALPAQQPPPVARPEGDSCNVCLDQEESDVCLICIDQEATRRLVPCGHRACCAGCAPMVMAMRPPLCPLCRTTFYALLPVVKRSI